MAPSSRLMLQPGETAAGDGDARHGRGSMARESGDRDLILDEDTPHPEAYRGSQVALGGVRTP
jgi:hypothetical protein